MNDPTEHATGLEKRELLAMKAGNDNPFDLKVFKRGPGTKDVPSLIPSAFDARLIGCVCEEEQTFISWMWLYQVRPHSNNDALSVVVNRSSQCFISHSSHFRFCSSFLPGRTETLRVRPLV